MKPTHLCPRCALGYAIPRGLTPDRCERCGGPLERLPGGRSKYGARRTESHGRTFASKAEATRYGELVLLQSQGLIAGLECQPRFPLVVNGVKVADYFADYRYTETDTGRVVVEDVKSEPTRKLAAYRLKKKLVLALHGVDIVEIGTRPKRRR
jgi:hypothetical protein